VNALDRPVRAMMPARAQIGIARDGSAAPPGAQRHPAKREGARAICSMSIARAWPPAV